ncbi:MAG: hypothetical protein NW207_07800 [Cytophagales bacterium]|nr:hypothetical protein [Cytophagales bacterium]
MEELITFKNAQIKFASDDSTTFKKLSNLANQNVHDIVSHQFRKFFQCYSMAFNKQNKRIGTLFQTPFKRALVNNDSYFTQLIYYIHSNAQHHGLVTDINDWEWSSYCRILIDKPSKLKKEEVIKWFGLKSDYLKFHSENQKMVINENIILEDD